jgi:hypothetical protein
MRILAAILIASALAFITACTPAGKEVSLEPAGHRGPSLDERLAVRQDGQHIGLSQRGGSFRAELGPGAFEIWIREYMAGTPVRICAWDSPSILEAAAEGAEAARTACFAPGTGMAVRPGNTTLFLKTNAHNFYVDERLSMKGGNGAILVDSFWKERREWPASKQKGSLFLLVFSDFDSNGRVDNGELMRIELDFR